MTRLQTIIMNKRKKTRKKYAFLFVAGVVLMTLVFCSFYEFETVQKKYFYPYPYKEFVERYAEANGVDSALAASVIMNESKFRPENGFRCSLRRRSLLRICCMIPRPISATEYGILQS